MIMTRPKVYEDMVTTSLCMDRADLNMLDRMRGNTTRGKFIATAILIDPEKTRRILELEAEVKQLRESLNKELLIKESLNKRLLHEDKDSPELIERRKAFIDNNLEFFRAFILNKVPGTKLVAIQRQLQFTKLQKLKEFFIEEYARRTKEGTFNLKDPQSEDAYKGRA